MREIIDIILNIVVPLMLIITTGYYVYRTGAFIKGIFMTWGLLAGYYWLNLFAGLMVFKFAPGWVSCFQDGPGVFVMTIFGGAVYGFIVSLTAMLARYFAAWVSKG